MSKSIYDEALEIIDNNTFELGKGLDVLKPTYRDTVVKALEKAQKQEKLLELYVDLAKTIEVLDNAYGYEIFEFGEIIYICNKIKENEK